MPDQQSLVERKEKDQAISTKPHRTKKRIEHQVRHTLKQTIKKNLTSVLSKSQMGRKGGNGAGSGSSLSTMGSCGSMGSRGMIWCVHTPCRSHSSVSTSALRYRRRVLHRHHHNHGQHLQTLVLTHRTQDGGLIQG